MEKHIVIVDDDYLKENLSMFSNDKCVITKTIVNDDLFSDDELHSELLRDKQKVEKKLRDYEYNIRHNFKAK